MLQNSNLTIRTAVVNQSGAMGSRYHLKKLQTEKKIGFLISFLLITSTLFGTNYDFTLKYKSYKVSNNNVWEKTIEEPVFMYISRDGKLLLTCGNNRYECSFASVGLLKYGLGFYLDVDNDNSIVVNNTWAMINIKTVCPFMNFHDCINETEIGNIISLIQSKSFFRKATSNTASITRVTCSNCNCSGKQTCTTCGGSGKLRCTCCNGTGIYYSQTCTCCNGTGGTNCYGCYGLGWKSCGSCYGSGYASSSSSSSTSYTSTSRQTTTSSATIEKVWADHNVYQNGQKGMNIHITFSVNNMYNKTGKCIVWFYFSDGTKLKDYNSSYRTNDGQVSAYSNFTSICENTIFNDFVVFMPYNELHLGNGNHSLKFDIGIFDNNGNQMKVSEYEYFNMQ